MPNKKSFRINQDSITFKKDITDSIFSTPKTPAKKVVYKDMIDSSIVDINIPSDDYNITDDLMTNLLKDISLIGEGDFYLVYKTGNNTALKKTKFPIKNTLDYDFYNKEVTMLKILESEYIVKYISSFSYQSHFYIETEYCNGGNLRDYITNIFYNKKETMTVDSINRMMYDISRGIEDIHKKGIVHLDIKPENIYVTYSDNIIYKIGDFNISSFIGEDIKMDGDKKYMAPEVLRNICTTTSDVFSLGLIYIEILRGINLPSKGTPWLNLRRGNFKGIEMDVISKKMLQSNFKKRCLIGEVVKYFRNLISL